VPVEDKLDLTNPNDIRWVRESILSNMISELAILKLLFKKGIISETEFLEVLKGTASNESIFLPLKLQLWDFWKHTDEDALKKDTLRYYHAGGKVATELMAELAGVNSKSNILMIGSGMGADARYLGKQYGCRVTAIDRFFPFIYHSVLRAKMMELTGLVKFMMADATDLPFKEDSFNVVWLQAVGLPLNIERKVIAEAYRVLEADGTYTIQDRFKRDDLRNDSYKDKDAFGIYLKRGGVFGIDEYKDILLAAGFETVINEVKKITPLFMEHDEPECLPYYERGDVMGAIVVARKGGRR